MCAKQHRTPRLMILLEVTHSHIQLISICRKKMQTSVHLVRRSIQIYLSWCSYSQSTYRKPVPKNPQLHYFYPSWQHCSSASRQMISVPSNFTTLISNSILNSHCLSMLPTILLQGKKLFLKRLVLSIS